MASEVFSVDIDLKSLQEALKISEKIKLNLAGGKQGGDIRDGIKKSNKELKVQNALLKTSYKTLQLIKLTMKGIVGGVVGLGALGLSGFGNAAVHSRRYRTIGINNNQGYSLDYASEMAGLNKDSLVNAVGSLQEALRDVNKLKDLSVLGLDTDKLKGKNPVDALFEVMQKTGEHSFKGTLAENVIKEAFDNIVGDYEGFRTLMGDNVKELQGYFSDGMRIYKDNYNNLKQGDQALIRLKNQFNRFRLLLATKLEPVITKIIEKASPLIEKGSDVIGKAVEKATGWFFEINKETGKTNLDQLFINLKNFANNMASFWEKIKPVLAPLGDALVNLLKTFLNNSVVNSAIRSKEQAKVTDALRKKAGIHGIGGNNNTLIYEFNKLNDDEQLELLNQVQAAYENQQMTYYDLRRYLEGVDYSVKNSHEGFEKYKKTYKAYQDIKKEYQVNDAVITKHGDIVKTSPQDYIFATKNPQALASGGNYTININANVRNDNDIQKIKFELGRLIKSFNANR